jgi:hypothetical protein
MTRMDCSYVSILKISLQASTLSLYVDFLPNSAHVQLFKLLITNLRAFILGDNISKANIPAPCINPWIWDSKRHKNIQTQMEKIPSLAKWLKIQTK